MHADVVLIDSGETLVRYFSGTADPSREMKSWCLLSAFLTWYNVPHPSALAQMGLSGDFIMSALGTCESAVCSRIEYRIESGVTIRIRIESRIDSAILTYLLMPRPQSPLRLYVVAGKGEYNRQKPWPFRANIVAVFSNCSRRFSSQNRWLVAENGDYVAENGDYFRRLYSHRFRRLKWRI